MDEEYYLTILDRGDIIILSSRRVYYDSGYFAAKNDRIVQFSMKGIKSFDHSSREGYKQKNPSFNWKEISSQEFKIFKNIYTRLYDFMKGVLLLKMQKQVETPTTFYKIKGNNLEIVKLLYGDKCEYIEFINGVSESLEINYCDKSIIRLEEYKSMDPNFYDFLKYQIETSLADIYEILWARYNGQ